jgi:hypothetical protein
MGQKGGTMKRTITIEDRPNSAGFARFTIRKDNGRPDVENPETITTDSRLAVLETVLAWVEGEE